MCFFSIRSASQFSAILRFLHYVFCLHFIDFKTEAKECKTNAEENNNKTSRKKQKRNTWKKVGCRKIHDVLHHSV